MGAEAELETKLGKWAKAQGCLFYKFSSPAHRGVPDRVVIGPTGQILFLELKAPGNKPTPLQVRELMILTKQGCTAHWADNLESAKALVQLPCLSYHLTGCGCGVPLE
jgi:hypothetical protein